MTQSGIFSKIAAILAALAIIFLPGEIFEYLQGEIVEGLFTASILALLAGWGFISSKASAMLPYMGAILGFIVLNRGLSSISLGIDALMIYVGMNYGLIPMFLVGTIVFFIACIIVVWLYGKLMSNGYDLLLIEEIRGLRKSTDPLGRSDALTRWVVSSDKLLFWVGSLWVESDIVTLLLRKRNVISAEETLKITLPSVAWCIGFWSIIFYLGILGYEYFDLEKIINFILLVLYLLILGYTYFERKEE